MYEYINGTVEVCVDGQYVPICGHSDYGIEANITDDIGISVCYSIGYFGEFILNVPRIDTAHTYLIQTPITGSDPVFYTPAGGFHSSWGVLRLFWIKCVLYIL